MNNRRLIIIFISILVIFGGYLGYRGFDRKKADVKEMEPEFQVTADELMTSYEADEAGADVNYLDKIIEVTGTVDEVITNEDNSVTVALTTSGLGRVNCTLRKTESSDIESGTEMTLRGECKGYLIDVIMTNCSIIQ